MYRYDVLRRQVLEDGMVYNPRLHKQYIPYQVLQRIALEIEGVADEAAMITSSQIIEYTIRGLRDTRNACGPRKDMNNAKEQLICIWSDGFRCLSDYLTYLGVAPRNTGNIVRDLHHQLADMGIDYCTESFYSTNISKPGLKHFSLILSRVADAVYTQKKYRSFIAYLDRASMRYDLHLDTTKMTNQLCELVTKNIFGIMLNAVLKSGYYYTARYFSAFSSRFGISDELAQELRTAVSSGAVSKMLIVKIYEELCKNNQAGTLPNQAGIHKLFNNNAKQSAGYTSFFT